MSSTPEPSVPPVPPVRAGAGPLGAVLCGGSSSRMGTDKARLGRAGDTWADRAVRALRDAGAAPTCCVGGDGRALAGVADLWVPDDRPGAGPLAAVAVVLRRTDVLGQPEVLGRTGGRSLLALACDLPALTGADLAPLVDALGAGAPVVVPVVGGWRQWSVVGLGPTGAAAVLAAVAAGERAWHRAVGGLAVEVVPSRPAAFVDVDTPDGVPPADRGRPGPHR